MAASLAEVCSVYPTSGGVYCESDVGENQAATLLFSARPYLLPPAPVRARLRLTGSQLTPDWAAMLSTPKYQAFSSYLTGWLGTVGNWT